jgi:hypothetical protein
VVFTIRLGKRMTKDISNLLSEWKYESEEVMVRIVPGDDGRNKIQLRVDLGLLQMEMDGRPDGERPEGRESWLEYYEERQRAHDEAHPDGPPLALTPEDCALLWRESVQYYHRYLSFWHLEMYEFCARDTHRNLRLFAFIRAFAGDDKIKLQFDQWRPYVQMMHTRAVATPLLTQKRFSEGLLVIETGIEAIREFLDEYNQSHRAEECMELVSLERWRDEILSKEEQAAEILPKSKISLLRRKLDEAVAAEQFEEAARLRDEIRRLGKHPETKETDK